MTSIINTNLAALGAQRALFRTSGELAVSLQRLTSGVRINSSKDDAAGLAIVERLTTQVRGYTQAIRNAADGISVAQTAEGGLESITRSLQRIRELAVQSANHTNSQADRDAIQQEVAELKHEIDRIANQTRFNGSALLDGSFSATSFQVGANVGETIVIGSILDANTTVLGAINLSGVPKAMADVDLRTIAGSNDALQIADQALDEVSSARAKLGATMNRFEQTVSNLRITVENQMGSRSRIQDADFATETAALTRAQILQQSGMEFLALANAVPRNVMALLQ